MEAWQERTALLLGDDSLQKLSNSRVLVAGLGGVGACAAEMLVRAGIGHLDIIDADKVSESNINRQIIALHSTIGRLKTDVLSERLKDIAPNLQISAINEFLHEDNIEVLLKPEYDFVVDAIDTLSPKTALISWCLRNNLPLVSSMGSGAKTDITAVRIADISKTNTCPLARALRGRLSRLGIKDGFSAVYSEEKPIKSAVVEENTRNKRSNTGTISYVPAVFGCACAQAAIQGILSKEFNFC